MKTSRVLAGLVALVLLMATTAFSAPSMIGPTGIVNVPTAVAVAPGDFELQLAYDRPEVAGDGINIFPVATLGYGFANGEIGVSYFNIQDYTSVKSANAKYIFRNDREESPIIAAGVIYLDGNTAETDLYVVASDRLGPDDNSRSTIGLLYQYPNHSGSNSNLTGMVGYEFGAPGKTNVAVDLILKDVVAGFMFGATVRQPISQDISVQVGMGNGNRYFFGMTMKFGGK